MKYRTVISVLCLAALASSCEPAGPLSAGAVAVSSQPADKPATYHYSPFVVQVPQSEMAFGKITFKDVGLVRQSSEPADPMLEAIAQSVSYQLQLEPSLKVEQTLVEYDEALTDPSNHTSCEEEHLYVDVWNGKDRWGYSLWSGCGESDNFAWKEVEIPEPDAEMPDRVSTLASAITASLAQAHTKSCYQKHCSCMKSKSC